MLGVVQIRLVRRNFSECSVIHGELTWDATNVDSEIVAKAFGYNLEQLQSVPAESHMGLSCGNPVAAATLHEVGFEYRTQVSPN